MAKLGLDALVTKKPRKKLILQGFLNFKCIRDNVASEEARAVENLFSWWVNPWMAPYKARRSAPPKNKFFYPTSYRPFHPYRPYHPCRLTWLVRLLLAFRQSVSRLLALSLQLRLHFEVPSEQPSLGQ